MEEQAKIYRLKVSNELAKILESIKDSKREMGNCYVISKDKLAFIEGKLFVLIDLLGE